MEKAEEIILPSALRVGMCQNCDRNYESKCLEHRTLELRDLVLDANYNKSSVCINFGNLGTSSLLDCNCPMTFGYILVPIAAILLASATDRELWQHSGQISAHARG